MVRGWGFKVCRIEGKVCGVRGALFCCFAILNGVPWSLLYTHETRVGCHVEGEAVCMGILQA